MNVTNKDFEILEKAIMDGKGLNNAKKVIKALREKKAEETKRKTAYIAEKRKTDKNYANKKKKLLTTKNSSSIIQNVNRKQF